MKTPDLTPLNHNAVNENHGRECLEALKVPSSLSWLDVTQIPPTPFEPVLVCGPVWKHEVAYLEPSKGKWIIGEKPVDLSLYPCWMPLPTPPFFD